MLRSTLPLSVLVLAATFACSDAKTTPSELKKAPPGSARAALGGFSCAVTYYAITQTDEAELAQHGVEATTDTAQVCESWTGNDYQVEVTEIGSSEPPSDFAEDVKTTVYQYGATSAYDGSGSFVDSQPDVGVNGFEFMAATPQEQQASYDEPYYGVIQNSANCTTPPCPVLNRQATVSTSATQASVGEPFKRLVLRHLLEGMSETTPSVEGYRRFRRVAANGEETTISVDPITELIRRQESKTNTGTTRADLTWTELRGKYVRDRLDMVSDEMIGSKRMLSKTSVVLRNVQWDPALVK